MLKNYNKKLIIVSMILFLNVSYLGTIVKAEDVVSQNNTTNSVSKLNSDSTNLDITKASVTDINSEANSDSSKLKVNNQKNNGELSKESSKEIAVTSEIPQWEKINGKLYYVTKEGIFKETGWFIEADVNPSGNNENEYYLDKDNSAVIGWKQVGKKWYYFDDAGVKQKGWRCINYNWYYFDKNGIMQTGWLKSNGNEYYFSNDGVMSIGKKYIEGNWYFFGDSGILQTGFYMNQGKYSYSNSDGIMAANEWIKTKASKYYIKADSRLATGSAIIDNVAEKFDNNGKYIGPTEIKDYLYIKYLNVGDADCTFIRLPNGKTVLIDTGTTETSKKVVDFLKEQNLKKEVIDYIVITHAHSDHIGGLASVLENFNVKKVYIPSIAVMKDWYSNVKVTTQNAVSINMMKTDYEVYEGALKVLKDNNIKFTNTKKGEFIDEDKILQFVESDKDFGPIGSDKISEYYWGINENSAIVYLNYEGLQALFTADMEWNSEKDFWQSNLLDGREVNVLKVSHHGSNTSSTQDFIRYLKPKIGIISRSKESIKKETAYNNLISNGVSLYETSMKDGISIYATKDNWTLGN